MVTQIAITPILHGEFAKKAYEESIKKPSKKSTKNAEKLMKYFNTRKQG